MKCADNTMLVANIFSNCAGQNGTRVGCCHFANTLDSDRVFIIAGSGTSAFGYYVPFMLVGSALLSVGAGLLSTFYSATSPARWIGYQIIAAAGLGMGFDAPQIAAQAAFGKRADMSIALVIVTSCMNLGGSLGVSIGSVILNNRITSLLKDSGIRGIAILSNSCLTATLDSLSAVDRAAVASAYGNAIQDVFHSTTDLAVATFILACVMDWRNIKDKHEAPKRRWELVSRGFLFSVHIEWEGRETLHLYHKYIGII